MRKLKSLWQNCQRGDWMLWLLQKKLDLQNESQLRCLTLAKARCAKLVFHLMKDERSRKAVDTAVAYGSGKATRQELDAAAYAADYAAAYAAADGDAAYAAAEAAACAAYAYADGDAAGAGDAAAVAAGYAYAAAYADDAADAAAYAYAGAKKMILLQCANVVREIFPTGSERGLEEEPRLKETEANARLIAAAPELLESLKKLYAALTVKDRHEPNNAKKKAWLDQCPEIAGYLYKAAAAIEKAEGN